MGLKILLKGTAEILFQQGLAQTEESRNALALQSRLAGDTVSAVQGVNTDANSGTSAAAKRRAPGVDVPRSSGDARHGLSQPPERAGTTAVRIQAEPWNPRAGETVKILPRRLFTWRL